MPIIDLPSESSPRFPASCARCSAPPSRSYRVRGKRLDAAIPVCAGCHARVTRSMVLWVVGLLIAIPFFFIVASLVLELVVPLPEEHGPRTMIAMVITLMLFALGGVMAWLGLRRGLSLHDRFFAPVFVLGSADGDRLVARSEAFARAVWALDAGADYRQGAGQVFVPPALPSYVPAVAALAVALGLFGAGFARYLEVQSRPTVLLRSLEIVAHRIAGAPGLLALYFAIAMLIGVVGVLWLVGTQRARRDILAARANKP